MLLEMKDPYEPPIKTSLSSQKATSPSFSSHPSNSVHGQQLPSSRRNHSFMSSVSRVIASGGFAGLLSDVLIHPLDVIKTRQQAQLTNLAKNKYKSIVQSFSRIVLEEGWKGVYSGITPAVLGSLTSHSVYFGVYETSKRYFIENGVNPMAAYFVCETKGAFGDAVASLIYVPTEVLKTRLQLQGRYNNPHSISPHNYKSAIDAFSEIWKSRGLGGIYHGLGATLLRDLPFTAIQFTCYETLKAMILMNQEFMTFPQELILGAFSGIFAGALTTPLDVIKTYLQTQTRHRRAFRGPAADFVKIDGIPLAPHYSGVSTAALGIYERSGWKGLFRGIVPRCVWTGSQSMLMFVLYETFLDWSRIP